jgi:D-alanyl-D-alanine carboxypeptidase/D-alanyl-D-alanine-endopeptidase (penicillin-binding protein 4)
MTFNWSAVAVFARPASKVGAKVSVFVDPTCDYFDLENSATTASGKKNELKISSLKKANGKEFIRVQGKLGIDAEEARVYKAVGNPVLWAGAQAKCFLSQKGIQVKGSVKTGVTPKEAKSLASMKSKPIHQIVADMMKFSNNYIAEIMTKNLGAQFGQKPAKMSDGVEVIRKYLKSIGLDDFELVNPSGLTRKNKFKPIHFFRVLKHTSRKFSIYPEFVSSLPVAGADGTLKNRLNDLKEGSQIRAKTGQLAGVIGLAGFIGRNDGNQINFTFIYNGPNSEMFNAKSLFDEMALALARTGGK